MTVNRPPELEKGSEELVEGGARAQVRASKEKR